MSLLDGGAFYEPITVYPQELVTDEDGNPRTQPATTGIPALARFQTANQSGTSARLQEMEDIGFESESVYDMRLPRLSSPLWDGYPYLGAQSEIEWGTKPDGVTPQRWAIFGNGSAYNSSPRTAHHTVRVKRF